MSGEKELKPCPLCGGKLWMKEFDRHSQYAGRCDCGFHGPIKPSKLEAVAACNRRATPPGVEMPEWWPENPYPESVFRMTTEQFIAAIPDENLRTSISGYCARLFFGIASQEIFKAYKSSLETGFERVPEGTMELIDEIRGLTNCYWMGGISELCEAIKNRLDNFMRRLAAHRATQKEAGDVPAN